MKRTLVTLALACASCGADPNPEPQTFVAFQESFAPYRTWAHVDLGSTTLVGHPSGPAVVYANGPRPDGCAWPIGTIIVKEVRVDTDMRRWELFAMVKRGGSYATNAAAGWEFFTLGLARDGTPVITGRGADPGTDPYSGAAGGGCNGCHGAPAARPFDSVLTEALRPRCATR